MSMLEGEGRVLPARPRLTLTDFDRKAVYGAAIVGFLVNLNALLIPIFQHVGGGLVAGFVAGYAAGRPTRGMAWGALAAALAGAATAFFFLLNSLVVGLYIEPPALLLHLFGPITPLFTGVDFFGILLLLIALVAVVAIDGLIAGAVAGGLRTVVHGTFGDS